MEYIKKARNSSYSDRLRGIELPNIGKKKIELPSSIYCIHKVMEEVNFMPTLARMAAFSLAPSSEVCDIIRSHVSLPYALLGKHAIHISK